MAKTSITPIYRGQCYTFLYSVALPYIYNNKKIKKKILYCKLILKNMQKVAYCIAVQRIIAEKSICFHLFSSVLYLYFLLDRSSSGLFYWVEV